ncbi:hypothetical protein AVEN_166249-1 [Araneus ventricosus]|uniref:Endonuclease/exonuclease/phosphatase domain-containing protein n=1 Tax=Araneus ventricosus TaxID=182803 RepID=A0A4Y2T5T1_ARAVE|nr:hypothetical protein AVEN_166249-1 [Araneus ventricosus]
METSVLKVRPGAQLNKTKEVKRYLSLSLDRTSTAPTFDSERGKSWIDLKLQKNISREVFKNWVVHQDVTASDHNLITYEITYEKSERPKNKCWKIEDLKLIDFRKDLYLTILKLKEIKINENNIEEILEGLDEIMKYICAKNKKFKNTKCSWTLSGGTQH